MNEKRLITEMWNNSMPRAFIADISGATITFNGRRRLLMTLAVRSATGFVVFGFFSVTTRLGLGGVPVFCS